MTKLPGSQAHKPRPQWKSRTGFILAAIGSAVGLGNIWRFSYLCYKNGGGAFLIPYLTALFVVGVPLLILELGIGHKMRGSAPMSFAKVKQSWEWLGWWPVIMTMFGIMLYYSVVVAWCLSYTFYSFNLGWGNDPGTFFFQDYLQKSSGPFAIGNIQTPILLSLLAVWFLCWLIVYFGVQKGVERANKVFMPLLFLLTLLLVGWSLSLEGAMQGIKVYLTPDFSALTDFKIWIDAFTQIFFTLSLGFGIMVAYASYLPQKTNIVRDGLVISLSNSVFSFIAGFAVFGTLGYMAQAQGVEVKDVVQQSIGLAFVAYPKAISLMPGFPSLFGFLFFASLVIAGLSSAISIIEAFSSALIDKFHYSREKVVTFLSVAGFAGSIIFTTQSGLFWLDIVDHYITNYGLVIVAILQCILVGWIYKSEKLRDHMNKASDTILAPIWDVCVRYIIPIILIILIINGVVIEFTKPYEGYPVSALLVLGKDWLVYSLIVALILGLKAWKEGHPKE